jgi:hypothetical protein
LLAQRSAVQMIECVFFLPVSKLTNGSIESLRSRTQSDKRRDLAGSKYKGSPYLKPMIGERARAATVRVVPQETRK